MTLDDQMVDCLVSRADKFKGLFASCWYPPADGKLQVEHVSFEDAAQRHGVAVADLSHSRELAN